MVTFIQERLQKAPGLTFRGNSYEDIINLPQPVSRKHPPMPAEKRAAQFAPFAALTGYEEAIAETAKRKEKEISSEIIHIRED